MSNAITISSQRFLNADIVAEKIEAEDYTVTVTPDFEVVGVTVRAVVDGHHSLAAAKEAGIEPKFIVATASDDDRIALLDVSAEAYLEAAYHDAAWYDVATSREVF